MIKSKKLPWTRSVFYFVAWQRRKLPRRYSLR